MMETEIKVRSGVDRRSPFPRREEGDIWKRMAEALLPERSKEDRRHRTEARAGWDRISRWSSVYLHNLFLE